MQHLIGLRDRPVESIVRILDRAAALRDRVQGGEAIIPLLSGRSVALIFMEPSTRTRFSFERAVQRLGASSLPFAAASSSTMKGETLLDTAKTLQAVGADAVILRHPCVGAPHQLARRLSVPVINAGDGTNEHPTQGLLDLLTLRDLLGDLNGKTIGIVGDVLHSRVARSNCHGLTKLGAKVVLAGPFTLCPDVLGALGVEVLHTMDEVLERADAVMVLRVQRERIGASMLASEVEYRHFWGMTTERLQRWPNMWVLHPGPMNRGVEIDNDVADSSRSAVFTQKANGVYVRMACLLDALEVP